MSARRAWLAAAVNRWEAASGASIDDARVAQIASELDLREYTSAQGEMALEWILRGNPTRFGALTLADFFPTPAQLESIAYEPPSSERDYQLGYEAGYQAGQVFERGRIRENAEYLRMQAAASDAVELDAREKLLAGREEALAARIANVEKREKACLRVERIARRAGIAAAEQEALR